MTIEQVVGLFLALFIMCIGLAGSILPGMPSTPIVLLAALGHRLYFGPAGPGNWVMALLIFITLASLVMDYLASMYGAKRLGASWKGILGAAIGGLIGIFFGFVGIIFGPFIGALVFELAAGRNHEEAARAGVGATLGLFAGALGKLACCIAMMGLFVINVLYRSLS